MVQTFNKLNYLLWAPGQMNLFTNYKNLFYVFDALALRLSSPRHVLSKVHRRAIYLSRLELFINHIEGVSNVFADILTRWPKGYRVTSARTNMIASLYKDIILLSPYMSALLMTNTKMEQAKYKPPAFISKDDDRVYRKSGKIWFPNDAANLKLMVAVPSHCVEKRQRAYAMALDMTDRKYWWVDMKKTSRSSFNHVPIASCPGMVSDYLFN